MHYGDSFTVLSANKALHAPPSSAEILKLSHQHRKKASLGSRLVVVAAFETYPQSGRALIQTYFSDLLKRIPRITVLKADLLKRIPRF